MSDPWGQPPSGDPPGWGSSASQPQNPPPPASGQPGYGQSGYGQSGYGQPGYGYPQHPPTGRTSGRATTVLVLGISSLVFWLFCGIGVIPAVIALVMAPGADREIAASGGMLGGRDQVKAGRIMSWITVGITALSVLAFVGLFGLTLL